MALAGPFAASGEVGGVAVKPDDARIVAWASEVVNYAPGPGVSERWQMSGQALGVAEGTPFEVVSLGRGGSITLGFAEPIEDGEGADFAVFENSFSATFLELAFVEVSVDGVEFVRFPSASLTTEAAAADGEVDATDVDGLAGKDEGGFGTPFDLATVGLSQVRFVRLIDIVGGMATDSMGRVIWDPFPTNISAGFDADGVAVLGARARPSVRLKVVEGKGALRWMGAMERSYKVEENLGLSGTWREIGSVMGTGGMVEFELGTLVGSGFYRVR